MITPNNWIAEIAPYKAGKSSIGDNKQVIKLSSNENPIGPSPLAIKAFKDQNPARYPDGNATEFKQAIFKLYGLEDKNIICGAGSDEIISFLCQTYCKAGNEVIHTEHGFLMYAIAAKTVGAKAVSVKETDKRTNIENIIAAANEKTKLVFLANPNNPTGSYISKKELIELRIALPDHVLLVIDGAYTEYVEKDDYSDGIELAKEYDNIIVTRTMSKIYGLAALRIGWAFAHETIIESLNKVRGPFNVSSPAISAAAAAILDTEYTNELTKVNNSQREILTKEFAKNYIVYDSQANFILVEFGSKEGAQKFNNYLLSKSIIVREVGNYGLETCLRISIGSEAENKELIRCLNEY